jgi:hypothetical protein
MQTRQWLAGLRRWRRVVGVAVLSSFVSSSVLASACSAMPLGARAERYEAAAAALADYAQPAHSAHGAAQHLHDHAGMPDCSHCPPAALDVDADPALCVTEGVSTASVAHASPLPDSFKLFYHARFMTLTATATAPPLIGTARAAAAPPVARASLNIRHCVFLI